MSAELLVPELRHAMVNGLDCAGLGGREGLRVERVRFVRNNRVDRVRQGAAGCSRVDRVHEAKKVKELCIGRIGT
jgi:hypothetical protein